MAAKKLTGGKGWSFEPAGVSAPEEIVSLPPERQKVKVGLERRAKGKEVTVIKGFVLSDADRKELAASLRKACGAGGADSRKAMEIQGDHRTKVIECLSGLGWSVK